MTKPKSTPTVAGLAAAPYNPRRISKDALANLRKSLAEFGDLSGVVFNRRSGQLVGGHQRVKTLDPKAAITKTPTTDKQGTVATGYIETPHGRLVYREVDWPPTKERAANVSANKNRGDWDEPLLAGLFAEFRAEGIDTALTGFTSDEIDNLLAETTDAKPGEDDTPPRGSGKGTARAGDLYLLGEHRLLVGSATDPDALARLMGGDQASMVFTDPPYGVSYDGMRGKAWETIQNDHQTGDDLLGLVGPALKLAAIHTRAEAAFYIWHASSTREEFSHAIKAAGLTERQYLIWAKPGIGFGHSDYQWSHEPCFYASKAETQPAFHGGRCEPTIWRAALHAKNNTAVVVGTGIVVQDGAGNSLFIQRKPPASRRVRSLRLSEDRPLIIEAGSGQKTTVWEVGRDHGYVHPTQKPVELARRAIENSSRKGEIILDQFAGSGTTIIGAEATGRRGYVTEIDPVYADVIIKRWEAFTGRIAVKS